MLTSLGTAGLVLLLMAAFGPMVVLLPQPPHDLRAAGGVTLAAGIAAAGWRYVHADTRGRRHMLGAATWFCLVTAATVGTAIALQPLLVTIPVLDVLPRVFGLQGEDITDAILFEAWFELWLLCLAVSGAALLSARAVLYVWKVGA